MTFANQSTPIAAPKINTIYFYLTHGCNLGCKHCWLSPPIETGDLKHPCLAIRDFIQVIREAKPLGLKRVKLTGGEPLLHPEISEILDIVRDENLAMSMETNGTLLNDAIAKKLNAISDCSVSISIDSTQASIHDSIRNKAGSFKQSVQGIKILIENGIRPQVITSLLPDNKNDIINIIHFCEEVGAGSFKLNIVQPSRRGEQLMNRGETVSIGEVLQITQNLFDHYCGRLTIPVDVTIPFAFRPLSRLHAGDVSSCGIMSILGVIATGEYALCGIGSSVQDLVFGRIGVNDLETVWKSNPVLLRLRADIPSKLEDICGECTMKWICLGSCIAQNYYGSGSLTAPYWFCRLADEQGLFPESRKIPPRKNTD